MDRKDQAFRGMDRANLGYSSLEERNRDTGVRIGHTRDTEACIGRPGIQGHG